MKEQGIKTNMLHLNELWPFPAKAVIEVIDKAARCYVIENNATGQLARLIKQETGKNMDNKILKFDGRPFSPERIIVGIRGE
jgi:2-oxoglutarate ferredoxin oxidoreductase subunit alpha